MIARIESNRNRLPLPVAAALFHRLEAVNAACDRIHDGGDRPTVALLDKQATLVHAIIGTTENGGAQ